MKGDTIMGFNHCTKHAYGKKLVDYSQIKDKIYYRIVSRHNNAPLLETVLHMDILDMAMVFFILLGKDETRFTSVSVCGKMVDDWNVTVKEIREQAERNTPILFPQKVCTLQDMVTELCQTSGDNMAVEAIQGYPQGKMVPYVLTNTYGTYGFSVVFYKGILKEFAGHVGSNLFVLPSSTHEALLIPENDNCNPDKLRQMVHEVNRTYVKRQDFLSDNIYYYEKERDRIQIAGQVETFVRQHNGDYHVQDRERKDGCYV